MYNFPDTQILVPEYRPKNPSPWDDEFDGPGIDWGKWREYDPIMRDGIFAGPEKPIVSQFYFNQSSFIYAPNYDVSISGSGNRQIDGFSIYQMIPVPYIIEAEVEVYMFDNPENMSAGIWIGDTDNVNILQWFIQKTSAAGGNVENVILSRDTIGSTGHLTITIGSTSGTPASTMLGDYMRIQRLRIRNDGVTAYFDIASAINNSFQYYNVFSGVINNIAESTPSSNFSAAGIRMQPGTRINWFRAKQGTINPNEIL